MDLGICRVLELLQHQRVGQRGDQRLGALDGAAHAARGGDQFQLGAEDQQHLAPFQRHRVRHGQDQAVALRRRDEGQRDAGIARGRLDQDGRPGVDAACFFRRLDHGEADAVLHRGQRIEELALAEDVGLDAVRGGDAREAHQRRRADGLDDRIVDAAAELRRGGLGRGLGGIGHGGFHTGYIVRLIVGPIEVE